ncbi:MAG: NO-inducible flavohemoprotein [Bacilli bacterium]
MTKLSQETIQIVKESIPALQEHGLTLTQTFYQTMFERNPELKNVFNMSNQRPGGKQPHALAQTILAAAQNIDQLEQIVPAIQHIGHKHRSLAITPEMYNIVGENLLLTLQKLFNQKADSPFIRAWAEAYGAIANAFITMENNMNATTHAQHGWTGFKTFTITRMEDESASARSIYLAPSDEQPLATHEAGQYISVRIPIAEQGYTQPRQYTLVERTEQNEWRICVKKEEGGTVSSALHTHFTVGQTIDVSAPAGTFVVQNTTRPTLLIAAGIGITPIRAMMNVFAASNTPTSVIYAVKNSDHHAMKDEIAQYVNAHTHMTLTTLYSEPLETDTDFTHTGIVTAELLRPHITPDTQVYICGPTPFMQAVKSQAEYLGVATEQIYYEQFGPAVGLA